MCNNKVMFGIFANQKPIIGMVHLRPLPGAPLYDPVNMGMKKIVEIAIDEAKKLENAGVDGIQIENIWDYPYLKGNEIGHETTASMAVAAAKIKDAVSIPIGINCHLNGAMNSMAVACAVGAKWIRVFEWVNAYISHAGIIEGIGSKVSRYRKFLNSEDVRFFCDINVKHGSHFIISDRSIAEQAKDAETEGADAIIVTGFETGKAPTANKVLEISKSVNIPIIIGSGTTKENVVELLKYADGAIVGSYFKEGHHWKNPVDERATREFMKQVEMLRKEQSNVR